jgi:hypothetical protein
MKPRWTSASYLVYLGGFTVLGAALYSLGYLQSTYGEAAFAAWSLLILAVLGGLAIVFNRRDRWVAAGLFAFASVLAFTTFVGALEAWFGWIPHNPRFLGGFHVGLLVLELASVIAALIAIAIFRFPLLTLIVAVGGWYFVTDLLSNGGNWGAFVTLFVGLFYLVVGAGLDRTSIKAYSFWLHVAAGLAVGGSFLYFWHTGDTAWVLVALVGLAYIAVAALLDRSSYAVLGSFGIFGAAVHFGEKWARSTISFLGGSATSQREWVPPIVLAAVGFLFVLLGLAIERRRRVDSAPVTPPLLPVEPLPAAEPPAPESQAEEEPAPLDEPPAPAPLPAE